MLGPNNGGMRWIEFNVNSIFSDLGCPKFNELSINLPTVMWIPLIKY